MSIYAVDSLHPDRLRYETCAAVVAALPDDGEAPEGGLTAGQVAAFWPQLAGDVAAHDAACPGGAPPLVRVRVAG
jgi:hypothetical protein